MAVVIKRGSENCFTLRSWRARWLSYSLFTRNLIVAQSSHPPKTLFYWHRVCWTVAKKRWKAEREWAWRVHLGLQIRAQCQSACGDGLRGEVTRRDRSRGASVCPLQCTARQSLTSSLVTGDLMTFRLKMSVFKERYCSLERLKLPGHDSFPWMLLKQNEKGLTLLMRVCVWSV